MFDKLDVSQDDTDASTWRLLAEAYGKKKNMGQSNLALAQEASLLNKPKEAIRLCNEALRSLPAGSPAALRARDLKMEAEKATEKKKGIFD